MFSLSKIPGIAREPATHTMRVGEKSVRFNIEHHLSRRFFLPRYANGKLHEEAATRFILDRLSPASTFVDVGSNLGYFSIVAAHFAGTVFAIDPQARLADLVRTNAGLNGLTNVHPICAAAGDRTGFVEMPADGRANTAVDTVSDGIKVPVIRLDDYFNDRYRPDVIKIDVEGYELNVLKGATALLAHGPVLAIELHDSMSDFGASPSEIATLLFDHGYRVRTGRHRSSEIALSEITPQTPERTFANEMIFCDRP